eukprot:RCo019304
MMKKEVLARMGQSGSGCSLPSSSCATAVEEEARRAKEQKLLQKFYEHSSQRPSTDAELSRTALLLISDIAVAMESEMRMRGAASGEESGLQAVWNLEKQRLHEKFKADRDIRFLHNLKEEWEEKLQAAKRKAGPAVGALPGSIP